MADGLMTQTASDHHGCASLITVLVDPHPTSAPVLPRLYSLGADFLRSNPLLRSYDWSTTGRIILVNSARTSVIKHGRYMENGVSPKRAGFPINGYELVRFMTATFVVAKRWSWSEPSRGQWRHLPRLSWCMRPAPGAALGEPGGFMLLRPRRRMP